jgi:5'-phosphate synthase pdxT subunit
MVKGVTVYGVLALQGDWAAHAAKLGQMGAEVRAVRTARELDAVTALVVPGGESSAMLRLMEPENLVQKIRDRISAGMAVLATCAGVILLAESVDPPQPSLGALAIDVVRNAYGRQVHSAIGEIEVSGELGAPPILQGVFIRAPRIERLGGDVEVLGRWRGDPVLIRQGCILGATFHPELTDDRRIHQHFLQMGEAAHV